MIGSVASPRPDVETWPPEVEAFLMWLTVERGRSANTMEAYRRDLRRFLRFVHRLEVELTALDADQFATYVAELRETTLAPASVTRAVVVARSLCRFMASEGFAPTDPSVHVGAPKVPAGIPKALTEPQIERLLAVVVGDDPVALRDRAIFEVLYGSGLRISELVGLSIADVDLEARLLRVFGKGAKERIVPLGRMAMHSLAVWFDDGRPKLASPRRRSRSDVEAVLLNQRGGRLTRQGAWLVMSGHARRAGLGDVFTPHVLRHSCATHMLDHGADIRAVQEMLGHASISTTQVYTKVATERLWRVYAESHPRAQRRAVDRPAR